MHHDERGAALIFAIVFVVVVSAIGGAMFSSLATGQYDRTTLDLTRNREYAADAAVEADIALVRSNLTSGATPCPATPFSPSPSLESPPVPITVTCSYSQGETLSGFLQRNATFSAKCTLLQPPVCPNIGQIVGAQVNFQSPSPLTAQQVTVTGTYVQSWTVGQ